MKLLSWIWSMVLTLLTAAKSSVPPVMPAPTVTTTPSGVTVTTPPTMQAKLVALIDQVNGAEGPFPVTGGQIFANTPAQTQQVASLIIEYANEAEGLTVPLFAAWIAGESKFSAAINPNNDKAKLGETPAEAFRHTDWGVAQFSGAGLAAWPDLSGLTWEGQRDSALDFSWAIPAMSEVILGLIAWAKEQQATAGSDPAWGLDPIVLAGCAYNSGRTGALKLTDFSYGKNLVARAATYAAELA